MLSQMPDQQTELDALFAELADPIRRTILARLAHGPATISDLARPFDRALPSFMGHLNHLEDGGLIETAKQGRVRTCAIRTGALAPARDWMADQRLLWDRRLEDGLETLTEEPKP